MNKSALDSLQKARNYAFLLIKFRFRSEQELRQRLKDKRFSKDVIDKTIASLKDAKLVDDFDFARNWIQGRLNKRIGLKRVRRELFFKGVNQNIIERCLNKVAEDYSEADIIRKIVQEKVAKLKYSEGEDVKRKLYAYFLRRGFSADTVLDVLSDIF